jgi:two-component system LytT family response regulator
MKIIAVDDNRFSLDFLTRELKKARPYDAIFSFSLPSKALTFVREECDQLDVAFLDVEMPGMSGVELAANIKKKFPRVIIIFVTAYPQYRDHAFKIHANGYLMKPISKDLLNKELNEIMESFITPVKGRIVVHTFGSFECYVDDKPIKFSRSKSKELLAYLVDRRGASCTMNELAAVLIEDDGEEKAQQRNVRNWIADLKSSLHAVNADKIILKEHNSIAIDVTEIDCDYYRFLLGEPTAVNSFLGEYMSNYSWAEFTVAELVVKSMKK